MGTQVIRIDNKLIEAIEKEKLEMENLLSRYYNTDIDIKFSEASKVLAAMYFMKKYSILTVADYMKILGKKRWRKNVRRSVDK